jgi:SAM-dependent methyltransferase
MNRFHRWACRSARWRRRLKENIVPWTLSGVKLGPEVLEIGPGPGLTTDLLRGQIERLTALEIDRALAASLGARLHGTNVTVIRGDATAMPFPDARFSGAIAFTMFHHVPTQELQDRLLREVCRVLTPGGTFAGVDSRQSLRMRLYHIRDTLVPVNPRTFGSRLEAAGFSEICVETDPRAFRFHARRPAAS